MPFVGVSTKRRTSAGSGTLAAYYSQLGSRGIILLTILRSWTRGAEAWGDKGIEKPWSSANARINGGGVDDPVYLRRLSIFIGTAERLHRTASIGHGRRTITRTSQEKPILTPASFASSRKGGAVVCASGTPAVLTQPIPWWKDPTPQHLYRPRPDRRGRLTTDSHFDLDDGFFDLDHSTGEARTGGSSLTSRPLPARSRGQPPCTAELIGQA